MSDSQYPKFRTFALVLFFGLSSVALGLKELNKHKRLSLKSQLSFSEGTQLVNALSGVIDPSKGAGKRGETGLAPSSIIDIKKVIQDDSAKAQLSRDPKLVETTENTNTTNTNTLKNNEPKTKSSIFTKIKRLFGQ